MDKLSLVDFVRSLHHGRLCVGEDQGSAPAEASSQKGAVVVDLQQFRNRGRAGSAREQQTE